MTNTTPLNAPPDLGADSWIVSRTAPPEERQQVERHCATAPTAATSTRCRCSCMRHAAAAAVEHDAHPALAPPAHAHRHARAPHDEPLPRQETLRPLGAMARCAVVVAGDRHAHAPRRRAADAPSACRMRTTARCPALHRRARRRYAPGAVAAASARRPAAAAVRTATTAHCAKVAPTAGYSASRRAAGADDVAARIWRCVCTAEACCSPNRPRRCFACAAADRTPWPARAFRRDRAGDLLPSVAARAPPAPGPGLRPAAAIA